MPTKGGARKNQPKGARLAYDDTTCSSHNCSGGKKSTKTGGGLTAWRSAVSQANKKLGTSVAVPRKGSKVYMTAKKIYGK